MTNNDDEVQPSVNSLSHHLLLYKCINIKYQNENLITGQKWSRAHENHWTENCCWFHIAESQKTHHCDTTEYSLEFHPIYGSFAYSPKKSNAGSSLLVFLSHWENCRSMSKTTLAKSPFVCANVHDNLFTNDVYSMINNSRFEWLRE